MRDSHVGCRETDDEEEGAAAEEGSDDGEGDNKPLTRGQIIQKAVLYLAIGAAACAFFSDPMVDAVTHFSKVSAGTGSGNHQPQAGVCTAPLAVHSARWCLGPEWSI